MWVTSVLSCLNFSFSRTRCQRWSVNCRLARPTLWSVFALILVVSRTVLTASTCLPNYSTLVCLRWSAWFDIDTLSACHSQAFSAGQYDSVSCNCHNSPSETSYSVLTCWFIPLAAPSSIYAFSPLNERWLVCSSFCLPHWSPVGHMHYTPQQVTAISFTFYMTEWDGRGEQKAWQRVPSLHGNVNAKTYAVQVHILTCSLSQ